MGVLLVWLLSLGGAPDTPVPVETCAMCHAQPAKRLDESVHGFIQNDPSLSGCETCHGPGLAHVLSDGDRAKIRNPRRLTASDLDAICSRCHADVVGMRGKGSSVHSTNRSCAACHVVHNPGTEPRITNGGRNVGAVEETPLASQAATVFDAARSNFMKSLESGYDPGIGLALTGSLTLGVRFVDVSGDESVYDQDVNLDGGFRVLEAGLKGVTESPDALFDRFEARAAGIDDPVADYLVSFEKDRRWEWTSGFRKQNWVYNSSGDYHHPFDVGREDTRSDFAIDVTPSLRFFAGYEKLRRSGEFTNTQFIDGIVFPTQNPVVTQTSAYRLGTTIDFGPCDVTLEEELRRFQDDEDRQLLIQGPLGEERFFDFRTDRSAFTPTTILRLHSAPWDGRLDLSLRALYSQSKANTDIHSDRRTNVGPGSPLSETLDGESESRRDIRAIEVLGTWGVLENLSLSGTAAAWDLVERGDVEIDEILPGGGRRSVEDESTSVKQRVLKGSLEALYLPIRSLNLRAGYEGELEDVRIDTQNDSSTVDSGGPIVGIGARPFSHLSIDALYRRARTDDPFTVSGAQTQDRMRARVRWSSPDGLYVSPEWTRSTARNQDSDTSVYSDALGLSAGYEKGEDLSLSASYFYRSYRSRTESNFTQNGVRIDEGVGFSNHDNQALLNADVRLFDRFRLQASEDIVISDGDFSFQFQRASVRPSYDLSWNLSLFLELSFIEYDETGGTSDDYDAFVSLIGARYRF